MSNQVIPFEAQLPAHIQALQDISSDDLISGAGGGFPVVSIKGKVFHIVRGDQSTLITRPDSTEGEPAASVELVILRANPNLSKTYYTEGYVEGADSKPVCYSNDGITPALDVQERQSVKCGTCPHNQWGSKISESGSKVKACADFRRMAVASPDMLNDPMLLRVPAASLKPLKEYGDVLKKRGVKYPAVVTRVGFDYSVAHPQLTFKPVTFLNEPQALKAIEMIRSDLVTQIVGMQTAAGQVTAPVTGGAGTVALASPKVETVAPVKIPVPSPTPAAVQPATKTVIPKPAAKATTQTSKVVEVNTGDIEKDLDAILAAAGFDDK